MTVSRGVDVHVHVKFVVVFSVLCNIGMAKFDRGSGCESPMCSCRPCLQ